MKITITITDELRHADVAITVHGEHTRPTRAKRVFDLILPALRAEFTPVKTHYRTRVRRTIQGAQS